MSDTIFIYICCICLCCINNKVIGKISILLICFAGCICLYCYSLIAICVSTDQSILCYFAVIQYIQIGSTADVIKLV